ncbi:MAG: hypothetical protein JNL83_05935 [Myxococcales bacterium]|nr:hypothetical protein [Myxococcales bacterium]
MRGAALLTVLLPACGFSSPGSSGGGGGGDDGPAPDASVDAAEPDSGGDAPVNLKLYAASNQMLYRLDVDLKTSTLIGPIGPAGDPIDIDGLALYGHTLIGITDGGGNLISIDKDTGLTTSTITLSPQGPWGGMTVIPAGELEAMPVVLAGLATDGQLYRIDPATGFVGAIGSFGGAYRFFSDLAWVKGAGLYGTLTGGNCQDVCFAKIDPATGAATVFRSNLGTNLFGLSGYRGTLWAFNSAGPILSVNQTSGLMAIEFDPQIPWTEAAQ